MFLVLRSRFTTSHTTPLPPLFYRAIRVPFHHGSIYDNKVGLLLKPKPRKLSRTMFGVQRRTSRLRVPLRHGSNHQSLLFLLNMLLSITYFTWVGTVYRLSVCYLLFIRPIFTNSHYTFYCSNMLLSIAYFTWGRVIIYDDNISYRSLSQAKRNIYIYSFYLFRKKVRCHTFDHVF